MSQRVTWSKADLERIAGTDDLHIAPFRDDRVTYGTPTWIWSVVVDDDLTCVLTTANTRVGTRPHCDKWAAVSLLPV